MKPELKVVPLRLEVRDTCPSCGLRCDLADHEPGDALTHACGARLEVQARFEDNDTLLRVWLDTFETVRARLRGEEP